MILSALSQALHFKASVAFRVNKCFPRDDANLEEKGKLAWAALAQQEKPPWGFHHPFSRWARALLHTGA